MVVEIKIINSMFALLTLKYIFRVEKVQELSQVDDTYDFKVNGKTISQDAKWVEVKPKHKQILSKQQGRPSFEMDMGKNLGKLLVENDLMASPMNFSTKKSPERLKRVPLGRSELQ